MVGSKMNQAHYNLQKNNHQKNGKLVFRNISTDIFNTFSFNCGILYQGFYNVQYKHLQMFEIMYDA